MTDQMFYDKAISFPEKRGKKKNKSANGQIKAS